MIIVSGHSPRNNYDNVDIWSELWGNKHCNSKSKIYPPDSFTKDAFFKRNKKIADKSDRLIVFINKGQFQSGAWNTLKYFLIKRKGKILKQFQVFDEEGNDWDEYPRWVYKYL